MFLARSGVQSTSFVAKRLKMERVQAYRTFKKLQEKGLIEATLERPTRFTIVSFEALLSSFIEAKKSEVKNLTEQKDSLMASWQTVSIPEPEYPVAKYSVITGKKKIHSKMLSMITESKKGIQILTTGVGMIHEDLSGIFDTVVRSAKKHKVPFRILTDISQENLSVVEGIYKEISRESTGVECRHLIGGSRFFPRFMIKDDEEAILYASSGDETSMLNLEDEGLWINDRMFISVLKAFYVQLWQSSVDARLRIDELKTGTPIGETLVIRDPEEAWKKVSKALDNAREDVIAINSSQSINSLFEKDPFREHLKKGVKFRVMAPVDLDNLETAKKLSAYYLIKHVPINYLTIMIIDNKSLFMFKAPPLNELTSDSFFYLADTFYSNDPKSVERVSEMLNDTWKRGTELSEISSQAGIETPTVEVSTTETLSGLADAMFKNNVSSVLITQNSRPIGIINERDLLKEMVENRRDPKKTLTGELAFTPLVSLNGDNSITDILSSMREKGIKRAIVIKNGQLVGMLTEDLAHGSKAKPGKTGT
jgi:CBS domain-containing protein/sugar-specific transcriptional regulator TrmB